VGQAGIPALNRTGVSMFWASTWENMDNFQQNMKEDMLLKLILPSFFTRPVNRSLFFFDKALFLKNSEIGVGPWGGVVDFAGLVPAFFNTHSKKVKVLPTYFSKV